MVAVVAAVTDSHAEQGAPEDAVLEAFHASLHGLAEIPHFAVDEEGSAPGPTTRIAEQIGKLVSLAAVPTVNALCDSTGLVGTADALADLLQGGWLSHFILLNIMSLYIWTKCN